MQDDDFYCIMTPNALLYMYIYIYVYLNNMYIYMCENINHQQYCENIAKIGNVPDPSISKS